MKFLSDGYAHRKEIDHTLFIRMNNLSKRIDRKFFFLFILPAFLYSCSVQKQIDKAAKSKFLNDPAVASAHTGISIYEPASGKYYYNYQGSQYFVPASNTKLFSCYAAMKYLGDSIAGIKYIENDTAIWIIPTGDPSMLHPDYQSQPVVDFLKSVKKSIYISDRNWNDFALGAGWSWDDYNDYYMAERSAFPVYGNVIKWVQEKIGETPTDSLTFDQSISVYSLPEVNWPVKFNPSSEKRFFVQREKEGNVFTISQGLETKKEQDVPFVTNGVKSALELLQESADITIKRDSLFNPGSVSLKVLRSRPTDSILRPMMYRSDNFFAEQMLLMVSEQLLGKMNDDAIADSLLRTDLKDLPQAPRWADGSGLSRFNLFTPQDFVALLNKMREQFGMERIKNILPTGGTGTLGNFYHSMQGSIYAKTGTLSGVIALSGFIYTKKNKLLIFSVLINNHRGNVSAIRKKVEDFLSGVYSKY